MYMKTIHGAWREQNSAGSPNFSGYHQNPSIKMAVPTPMHIMLNDPPHLALVLPIVVLPRGHLEAISLPQMSSTYTAVKYGTVTATMTATFLFTGSVVLMK
ncbi:hypothetical protein JB92DRAFT_2827156 [Gautieria morchelliformis]|nr:hypothetical protein JB92DRAFT_2827156 [Gautieria morchelliformis]